MRLIDATTLKAEFTGNFRDEYPTAMIKAIIDTAPTVRGWISVEDRLPEDGMSGKLVYDPDNGVHICYEAVTVTFPDGKTRISSDKRLVEWMFANLDRTKPMPDDITHITHWMPLPEAPQ